MGLALARGAFEGGGWLMCTCFLRERRKDCGWWTVVLQSKDMVGRVDGRGGF